MEILFRALICFVFLLSCHFIFLQDNSKVIRAFFLTLFWQVIEKEAKNFIDESFKTLRSAEAAFDMLLKFKHIRSREAINRQMMMKFNDILAQYCKEVTEKKSMAAVAVKIHLAKCHLSFKSKFRETVAFPQTSMSSNQVR